MGSWMDSVGFAASPRAPEKLVPTQHSVRRTLAFLVVPSGISAAICIPMGLVLALASGFMATTVSSAAGVAHVRFGYPIHWVTQDQTLYTPTQYPAHITLASPKHSPTQLCLSC